MYLPAVPWTAAQLSIGAGVLLAMAVVAVVTSWAVVKRHGPATRLEQKLTCLWETTLTKSDDHGLLQEACAVARDALEADCAAVLECVPDQDTLVVRAGDGWKTTPLDKMGRQPGPRSLVTAALAESGTTTVDDFGAEQRFERPPLFREQGVVGAALAVIAGEETPYGLLGVFTRRRRKWQPRDLEFLRRVAALVGSEMRRRREVRTLASKVQQSAAEAHVASELVASHETKDLLDRVCRLAAETIGAEQSHIWMPDEHGYGPIAASGLSAAVWSALSRLRMPEQVYNYLLEKLGAAPVVELSTTEPGHPLLGALLEPFGASRLLIAMLFENDRGVGLIAVGRNTTRFTGREIELFGRIAELGSHAFANVGLLETAERASELKSEFVSTMSHELRTPLNVIIGYLDMLADQQCSDEQMAILGRVRNSGVELLDMVEATLNLNRIAQGTDIPQFAETSMEDLWTEMAAEFAVHPRKTNAELRWEPVAHTVLYTDRRKLKMIVKNIVGNALKFTSEGEVVVRCQTREGSCVISVTDTGIGIPATHLPVIFEMFRQVDSSDARSYAGAGLGLFIVRKLLDQLGGDISVESIPEKGSTFRVTLPPGQPQWLGGAEATATNGAGVPDAAARPASQIRAAQAPRKQRILYADDLELNRALLRRFVARHFPDVEFFEAADGLQATAAFEAEQPDVVLLDLRMPTMDGWQAARRIRCLPGGSDVPIIAITITASSSAEAYALHAGCTEFIAKPISDYSVLLSRLEYWLQQTSANHPRGADTRRPQRRADSTRRDQPPTCALCRQPLPQATEQSAPLATGPLQLTKEPARPRSTVQRRAVAL
jgi:signal transduction histidine kinase/DNA-binding response OmpR family regulator